jgi:ABC-type phosphate transport system substrate-binding protein
MPHCRPFLFTILLALVATVTPGRAAADGFALICNAKASTQALSKAEVRSLYTGKAKTFGGSAVLVVVRPDDDAAFGQFVDHVFGIPAKTLMAKIKQEVFKGEMSKPVKAATDDEVVQAVTASPGTIGVVSAQAVAHLPKTISVISIGG